MMKEKKEVSRAGKNADGQQAAKVWHAIMAVIYRNPEKMVKLPSSRGLAEELGMARSTVSLVYKKLQEKGFIVCRHGSGTYTNPRRALLLEKKHVPLIGMLFGSGDNFCFDNSAWEIVARLGRKVCAGGNNCRLFQNGVESRIFRDCGFQFSSFDALLSYGVCEIDLAPVFREIPMVRICWEKTPFPTVFLDHAPAATQCAELCREKGCRDLLVHYTEPGDEISDFAGLAARALPGMKVRTVFLQDEDAMEQTETFLKKHPHTMLLHYNRFFSLMEELRSRYPGLVTVSYRMPPAECLYHGYFVDFPWEEAGAQALQLLAENRADRSAVRRTTVDAFFRPFEMKPL